MPQAKRKKSKKKSIFKKQYTEYLIPVGVVWVIASILVGFVIYITPVVEVSESEDSYKQSKAQEVRKSKEVKVVGQKKGPSSGVVKANVKVPYNIKTQIKILN